MPRTTTRRVATTGLGALAATTALALAAPSALAATPSFVLDPGQDVLLSAFGYPLDADQLEDLDATPVDLAADGTVTVLLPDLAVNPAPVTAVLVTEEAYEESLESGEAPVTLTEPLAPEPDLDEQTLTVVLPTNDEDLIEADEVLMLLSGLEVAEFPDAPPFEVVVPLDLDPTGDAADLVMSPAEVDASYLEALSSVEEPVAARAGETFEVVLPQESSLRDLGVEDLDGLDGFVLPLSEEGEDEEADLVLESFSDAFAAVDGDSGAATAAGLGRSVEGLAAEIEDQASEGSDAGDVAALEVDDVVASEAGGSTAVVRPSEDLQAGSYLMVLFPLSSDDAVSVVSLGQLDLAAAPAPAPEPVPTVTVTAPPVAQNPGLRSNTGVEGGGVDGGLVAAGAAVLAVGAAAGAAALRPGRRGRRA